MNAAPARAKPKPESPTRSGEARTNDLERRRELGQFFTPARVAGFMWDFIEVIHGAPFPPQTRLIDPACGDGVFLRVAHERGHLPSDCLFGTDVDETLVPGWREDASLGTACVHLGNRLADAPSLGIQEGTFDIVAGNPPFSGKGLRELLRLLEDTDETERHWELDMFEAPCLKEEPAAPPQPLSRGARLELDRQVRTLSPYACWRLTAAPEEDEEPAAEPESPSTDFFAGMMLNDRRRMRYRKPIVPPTFQVEVAQIEMVNHDRWTPGYFDLRFRRNERALRKLGSVPLGNFIPDELPDGSKGITYGQVGARKLSPRGAVRYLQVINIRDTGIDFAVKPDRVAEGSHNDPERSRVCARDILFTNNAFRGTDTLIGRCIAVPRDYGKLNISQHIDRIRVEGIDPFYVCCFLKSQFGALQVRRVMHGVDAMTISFGHIRRIEIPELPLCLQTEIQRQYLAMAKQHDRAMAIKERVLEESGIEPGQYGTAINELANQNGSYRRAIAEAQERLKYLIGELEAVLDGQQKKIRPFPG